MWYPVVLWHMRQWENLFAKPPEVAVAVAATWYLATSQQIQFDNPFSVDYDLKFL